MFWVDHLNNAKMSGSESKQLLVHLRQFFNSTGVERWVKYGLSIFPNFRGLQIAVEESSVADIMRWLRALHDPLSNVLPFQYVSLPRSLVCFLRRWIATVNQERDLFEWRDILLDTGSEMVGYAIGRAAGRVWACDDLSDFNQTAAIFLLAMKYFLLQEDTKTEPIARERVLQEYVTRNVTSVPGWAGRSDSVNSKNLGVAYYTLRQWDRCIPCFQSKTDIHAGGFRTSRYLGEAYLAAQKYDFAIAAFKEATHENPTDSLSWIGLGEAYKSKKDFDGAIEAFRLGREKNPRDPWYWKGLGEAYLVKCDYNSAIANFRTAVDQNPEDSYLWGRLGVSYYRNGDTRDAIAVLRQAIETFPTVTRLWKHLIDVYSGSGDIKVVDELFETLSERFPTVVHHWATGKNEDKDITKLESLPLRNVWLLAREVQPRGYVVNDRHISDWALLVSSLGRQDLEEPKRRSSFSLLGDVHELWNNCGTAEYRTYPFTANEFIPAFKPLYIGETMMSDWNLENIGTPLVSDANL